MQTLIVILDGASSSTLGVVVPAAAGCRSAKSVSTQGKCDLGMCIQSSKQ